MLGIATITALLVLLPHEHERRKTLHALRGQAGAHLYIHDLRKRKVDKKRIKWIASFLTNRHTSIAVDGYLSKKYAINTGIPQGSRLSPILYLFYNADLIDECNQEPATMSTGYIDDVGILTWGKTTEETCDTLSRILKKAQHWANTHASIFAPA